MKKSHKVLLSLLGVIVLAVIGFKMMQPKEPEYQGRKLSEWIADLGEGPPKDQQALEVIKQMPEQVLPFVEARIRNNQDPAARSANQRILIGIQEKLFGRRSSRSYQWAVDFGALRGLGTNALPALERLLIHRDSCGDSADTLAELDAIEVLAKGVATDQPSFVRWNSIRSLGMVPARKNEATDLLVPLMLQNTNGGIVVITMQSLGQLHSRPEIVIPLLCKHLEMNNKPYAGYAASALAEYGTNAAVAIPALQKMKSSGDMALQKAAEEALRDIVPNHSP